MVAVGIALAALIAICGALAIGIFRSHERDQQDEIEALQGELQEVAQWVDTGS